MKRRGFWSILCVILLTLIMAVPVLAAEGKMNVAVLCVSDDAKVSAQSLEQRLKKNKLPYWRYNKTVSLYSDEDNSPTTKEKVDSVLDSAFGNSTGQDINYLFIAGHGYNGSLDPKIMNYYETGLIMDVNAGAKKGVYKFTDLVGKLTGYKGQFVVVMDTCYSQNFVTRAFEKYPTHIGRFTILCSADEGKQSWGVVGQAFISKLVKLLKYNEKTSIYPGDENGNGFFTVGELEDTLGKGVSGYHVYGSRNTDLFQFGYVKMSKKSLNFNLEDTTSYKLGKYAKKYSCTSKQKIKWKSSNSSVVSVDKNGKLTLKKDGTATITAYIADAKGNMCLGSEAKCTVKVVKPKITLNKTAVTLYKDETAKLIATVTGTKKKVTWKSSKSSVVSVKNGKITAKKPGTAKITAKAGKVSASCKVTVKKPTITLKPTSKTIEVGSSFNIKATVKGKSKTVKWSTSNKNAVTVSGGTVYGKKVGTATIKAQANGVTAKCKITVKKTELPKMNKSEVKLIVGYGENLYVTIANNPKKYISQADWYTSNPKVVYVDETNGRITGIGAGTATITAKLNGKSCTCKVTVTAVKERKEVTSFLKQDIHNVAKTTNAGGVGINSYGLRNDGFSHYCDAEWQYRAMYKYYTGINDYENKSAYEAASFPIRFEAFDTGSVALIETTYGDDYTYAGLFRGMYEEDMSNMLSAHGYKWKSFVGNQNKYSSLNGDGYRIIAETENGKVTEITIYRTDYDYYS